MLDRCAFGIGQVVVGGARRDADGAFVNFGIFVEERREVLHLLLPRGDVQIQICRRKNSGLFRLTRQIGGCVFLLDFYCAIGLNLNEPFHGCFVLFVGLQP